MGSRDGTVVRALASHQCVPGSIPRHSVICGLSLLLVLLERFSFECRKTKTKVITKNTDNTVNQSKLEVVTCSWRKAWEAMTQLILVLLLFGWKSCANLLSQSRSVVNAKPITFRHSNENRSICSERFFSGFSGFLLSSKTNISKSQFDLDYCQALYHEPLARVIAQALPVFDIKFTSHVLIKKCPSSICLLLLFVSYFWSTATTAQE